MIGFQSDLFFGKGGNLDKVNALILIFALTFAGCTAQLKTKSLPTTTANPASGVAEGFASTLGTIPPVTSVVPAGGSYTGPVHVDLNCVDLIQCESIVYSLDGSDPDFNGSGFVVADAHVSITVGSSDSTAPEVITLKFRARNKAGMVEPVRIEAYTINPVPLVPDSACEDLPHSTGLGTGSTIPHRCECVPTHAWSQEQLACVPTPLVLELLN